jgi:hypothetical protein
MRAFVIHHPSSADRSDLVQALRAATGADVIDAVWFDGPERRKEGCSRSHMRVAEAADASEPYLVFEDDCILADDWKDVLQGKDGYDVVYLGVNSNSGVPFGTHALLIGPAARKAILEDTETMSHAVWDTWAFDHILHRICTERSLSVWVPDEAHWNRWALQKKGLVSTITGVPRT